MTSVKFAIKKSQTSAVTMLQYQYHVLVSKNWPIKYLLSYLLQHWDILLFKDNVYEQTAHSNWNCKPQTAASLFNNLVFCYMKCEDMDFWKKSQIFFFFSYGLEKKSFLGDFDI